jgi:5-(carboxyamino)imidazole ribonucleotide mutase
MKPLVGVVMGSRSDWETMRAATSILEQLGVPHEVRVVSAHRTPDLLFEYAATAETRGLQVIIAGAGGAAHLPGMIASKTTLPVLGVPVQSKPVATFAIGNAGATNAALTATAILARHDATLDAALKAYRAQQTAAVLEHPDPRS